MVRLLRSAQTWLHKRHVEENRGATVGLSFESACVYSAALGAALDLGKAYLPRMHWHPALAAGLGGVLFFGIRLVREWIWHPPEPDGLAQVREHAVAG